MQIKLVEIQNFRKLKSVRIDFSTDTTVLVGANNSGKTSAMSTLRRFLVDSKSFSVRDFTLSHWSQINDIGEAWLANSDNEEEPKLVAYDWDQLCPAIDVWLEARVDEVHLVRHLVPTLEWGGGLLGVRLKYVPEDLENLYREYVISAKNARDMKDKASGEDKATLTSLKLWPVSLAEYIERRLLKHFKRKAFLLDPSKLVEPERGIAKPQLISDEVDELDVDPFEGLIRVDEIDAQRGFSDPVTGNETAIIGDRRSLSGQLRKYYQKHIDPTEAPEPKDLEAMYALQFAQRQFDEKLREGFSGALAELEDLGYPGITDPKVTISSQIQPAESLNHDSAVQYAVIRADSEVPGEGLRLPEQYIGLGYQNLISMVFRLMAFRDAWMQVGKASKTSADGRLNEYSPPPIHLVMVEEPEAHLHAQVQQVFIRKAYSVLRNHPSLGAKALLSTQLVVSTHSSHIAHESNFSSLRYFRRLPAGKIGDVPISSVANLSEVFGRDGSTAQFVSRYLKSTHCDLFFADAAILIEGPVERMLVPLFIQKFYPELHARYVTLLDIGGSHAHRLRPLIEKLHLPTLIITDLDPARNERGWPVALAERGADLITRNPVLRQWLPRETNLDVLLDLASSEKVVVHDELFSVCVAYQHPVEVQLDKNDGGSTAVATTFEDALVFDNVEVFRSLKGRGLIKKFSSAVRNAKDIADLSAKLRDALSGGGKAEFALDLLYHSDTAQLRPPTYICDGLNWLREYLDKTNVEVLPIEQAAPEVAPEGAINGG
tara:strand:- start:23757 stop:26075 length:2319 start_codon:yes stop_codon:yes gene_type:complete